MNSLLLHIGIQWHWLFVNDYHPDGVYMDSQLHDMYTLATNVSKDDARVVAIKCTLSHDMLDFCVFNAQNKVHFGHKLPSELHGCEMATVHVGDAEH